MPRRARRPDAPRGRADAGLAPRGPDSGQKPPGRRRPSCLALLVRLAAADGDEDPVGGLGDVAPAQDAHLAGLDAAVRRAAAGGSVARMAARSATPRTTCAHRAVCSPPRARPRARGAALADAPSAPKPVTVVRPTRRRVPVPAVPGPAGGLGRGQPGAGGPRRVALAELQGDERGTVSRSLISRLGAVHPHRLGCPSKVDDPLLVLARWRGSEPANAVTSDFPVPDRRTAAPRPSRYQLLESAHRVQENLQAAQEQLGVLSDK